MSVCVYRREGSPTLDVTSIRQHGPQQYREPTQVPPVIPTGTRVHLHVYRDRCSVDFLSSKLSLMTMSCESCSCSQTYVILFRYLHLLMLLFVVTYSYRLHVCPCVSWPLIWLITVTVCLPGTDYKAPHQWQHRDEGVPCVREGRQYSVCETCPRDPSP